MSTDILLLQAAEVLEKTAAYLEAQETDKALVLKEQQNKTASKLATKVSSLIGEQVPTEVLTGLNPEIQNILDKVAGQGDLESLGEPDETIKTAGNHGELVSADERFTTWVLT